MHKSYILGGRTALTPGQRVSFQFAWDTSKGRSHATNVEVFAEAVGDFDPASLEDAAAGKGATLLIGGLPSDVQEEFVESLVAACCSVRRIRIALDPQGGSDELGPSRAALVDVASDKEARAAEEAVGEAREWVGESLRVRVCRPNSNAPQNRLYVSGLPLGMKEDKVAELFSQHGSVSQVMMLLTKGWGQSALVTVADVEEAALISRKKNDTNVNFRRSARISWIGP